MNNNVNSITVTIPNPTSIQVAGIAAVLAGVGVPSIETIGTTSDSLSGITKAKRGVSKKPGKTVSPDEDEDFAKEALEAEDLEDDADEEEEEESDEDEDEGLDFSEVKDAIDRYGAKNPDAMKAILSGFNLKGTKELKNTKGKWEPVYRKVMAKLKALKKK